MIITIAPVAEKLNIKKMNEKTLIYRYCGDKDCIYINNDGTCVFTECCKEIEDEFDGMGRG